MLACHQPNDELSIENLQGTWLGGSFMLDKDYEIPISQFMEINDSSQVRYITGMWRDTFQDLRIEEDSIHFPYRSYEKSELSLSMDKMRMGKLYKSDIKRVDARVINLDTSEIKNFLISDQWATEGHIFDFSKDSVIEFDIGSGYKNRYCWDVNDFYGYKLFHKRGSFLNCESPFYGLGVIHSVSKDSMILECWLDGAFKTLTYKRKKVDTSSFVDPEFKMCNPRLYEHSQGDWYFFKYPSFTGGLYALKKIFDKEFQVPKTGEINGLLRVQFVINCVGEIGKLETVEMNGDYKKMEMNPRIRIQVLDILTRAGKWLPAEQRGEQVDAYKYLIFKIKDGKIDEIYP